jgi:hypothetical protein
MSETGDETQDPRDDTMAGEKIEVPPELEEFRTLDGFSVGPPTDEILRLLAHLPWQSLDLDGTNVDDRSLRLLGRGGLFRGVLSHFGLWRAKRITDASLAFIASTFASIQHLILDGCTACTNEGLAFCQRIAGLRQLTVSNWSTDGSGLAHVRSIAGLNSLEVTHHASFDSNNLRHLAGMPLATLSLRGSPVKAADFAHLQQIKHLVDVDLTTTGLDDAGLAFVCDMGWLESLRFDNCPGVTNNGFALLPSLKLLKSLRSGCPVDDEGARAVLELPSLEELRFTRANITDLTVTGLLGRTQIQYLGFDGCKGVTDASLPTLAQMAGRLKKLSLRGTGMTRAAALTLMAVLPGDSVTFAEKLEYEFT